MTDKVQKIREEFKRLREQLQNQVEESNFISGEVFIINYFLTFIDSLQEEPVSEELENAGKEWLRPQLDKCYESYGEGKMMELTHFDGYAMLDAIEFGAQWQKEKDFQYVKKECERTGSCCDNDIAVEAAKRHPYYYASETEAYANIGFKEGAMWQKEQMISKATEVTVHIDAGGYPYIPEIELYDYDKDVPLAKEGDKYKVVLIKKE